MRCPKCDGQSVFPAINEAPDGARDWRKCMSCGMRWDPTKDVLDTVKRAFEEWQPEEEDSRAAGDEDEGSGDLDHELDRDDDMEDLSEGPVVSPLDLAMKDVLVTRGRKKKEGTMPKFVSEEHRERWIAGQERSRQLKREAAGGGQCSASKKKPGRPRKVSAAVVSVPAMHQPDASIAVTVGTMPVLSMLDRLIVEAQADVQALERVREIMARGGR